MKPGPYTVACAVALLFSAVFLATHAPFAFHSPDMGLHTAKILRAERGEWFRDPVSGTLSIYPSLFHVVFGAAKAALGLGSFDIVRLILLVDFASLFASFFLLARTVLRDSEAAAVAALLLPLLFYSPSGRHVLVASPANFALPLLLLGYALIHAHMERPRPALLFAGFFAASLAANVAWYEAVPVLAFVLVWMWFGARHRDRLGSKAVWLGLLGLLLPCAFTAFHLWSIRDVLPAYSQWAAAELRSSGLAQPGLLLGWLPVLATKGNERFAPLLERSAAARLHYYGLVLPFTLGLLAYAAAALPRLRRLQDPRQRSLALAPGLAAALVFLLSIGLNAQKDPPRVQFVGWALLLVFGLRAAETDTRPRIALAARPLLAAAGLAALAYTVVHTREPFPREIPRATRAAVDFIRGLEDHSQARLFATRASLRRLNVFVPFLGFVNHSDGRYQAQDPETTRRLLDAYLEIEERRAGWRDVLREWGVRHLAFRHLDPREREIGLFYLRHGRAVVQNAEWWVVELQAP